MERMPEQGHKLQEFWDRKVKEELQADRKKGQLKEAKSLRKYIRDDVKKYAAKRKKTGISPYKLTTQQYEAFQWFRWGVPQDVAAEIIGISQSAFSQRLVRLFERYPELEAVARSGRAGQMITEMWPRGPIPPSAFLFGDKRYTDGMKNPFHIPGKTKWPEVELEFSEEDEKREERRLKKMDEEPELRLTTDLDKALGRLPEDTYNR